MPCFIYACLLRNFSHKVWLPSVWTPLVNFRSPDNVWEIVVRFTVEAKNLSLLQTVQTASVDPHNCLSTARPTAEYFPVAKAAGTQSCQHSPAKMLKIITAIPPISLHGPQINNCHTN